MKQPSMPMGIKQNAAPPKDAASPKGEKLTFDTKITPATMRKNKMRGGAGKLFGSKPKR